ncbi:TonB-dependent receptor [Flavobacterium longum]|uniref:outer membrane beta-barrel protein n=1 Tax=Flavobacterium longum TaxID=1299340 RepID=UPI0039EC40BF
MRHFLLSLTLLVSGLAMQAQNATLSGKVTDKSTNQPLPYATIVLKEADKVITGGITDDNGLFDIKNLVPKNYAVEIQFMGYKTHLATADFTTGQRSISLGTIALADESTKLNEVTVVAERSTIEQKIDRKVINVGKDLTTAGATASEILGNIPSVNVDQDGKISLRGNENVRVLVDGRPTNIDVTQLLRQIPSTSIKKIELITNPSAKYNPEGMSGIINIVLHKNANDGFNASINTGLTFAVTPKINNSVNMNYRTGKVNFFGTYGDNFGKQFNDGNIYRLDDQSRQVFDIVNDNNSHLFKLGMDFYLNDKNTISVYTNQNFYSGNGVIDLDVLSPISTDQLFQQSKFFTDNQDGAYNIAYKKLFAKEAETLDVEINHDYFREVQRAEFLTDFVDPAVVGDNFYQDYTSERRKLTTANVDYVKPLNERTTLEIGAEARVTRTENNYLTGADDNLEEGDPQPVASDSDFNYDIDIYSAYGTFGQRIGKYGYQLGMRFESYKVHAAEYGNTIYEDDYITAYPSASVTYSPTEKNMWQVSYSRRVDRPSLEQTRPIREFATPRVTSLGNPELDPQFTNSVEVNYTRQIEQGSITAGIFGRIINDEISRVLYPDPENEQKQILSFQNFDTNTAFGFEVSANYKITKWWDIQPAVDFSSIRQKGAVSILNQDTDTYEFTNREVTASALNARINSNFRATKSLRFLIFGFYRGSVQGLQFESQPMYKIDAGGRYSFLKDKATLSVRFNDIFNTQEFGFDGDVPYPQTGSFGWESRSVYIGFNYSFGAGKNRALQRKQRDDNTQQGGGGFF